MFTPSENSPRWSRASLPRRRFLVIAGLILLSTVLFLVGTAIERGRLPAHGPSERHQELGTGSETHEGAEATPAASPETQEAQESHKAGATEALVFGINVESP